jgi:hypothetical protein
VDPAAQEAKPVMGRVVPLFVAVLSLAAAGGCFGPVLYRAAGHLPGVAATDYAFSFFCDTASQLYPFSPAQVESAMKEALGDLGFQLPDLPVHDHDGETRIRARTPDGRPAKIRITPQNAMTNVRVAIGTAHLGDYELSRDLLRRVALNFGTGMRAYTPVETTLPRRFSPSRGIAPAIQHVPPPPLEGEGLRPGEGRTAAAPEEMAIPGQVGAPGVTLPDALRPFIPTRDFPNPPYMPYSPFPYTPYNSDLFFN